MTSLQQRCFFWGSSKATPAMPVIDKEDEMKVMQYRGQIEDFF